MTYLGTTLTANVTDHIDTRRKSARRAYYGLQGAGVCCDGVAPKTLSHIYKVVIQPILTYGCAAISINNRSVKILEKNSRYAPEEGLWNTEESQKLPTVSCPWN